MATYTTPTGVTYSSADKIAISLIESPPTGRALSKSEKEKIAAYMARPAQERAAIEQAFLGHPVSGAGTTPTPTTPTPTTPTPTTPTPTTPPAGGTTPTLSAADVRKAQTVKDRIDQQVADYNVANKTSYDIEQYLDALMSGKGGAQITQATRDSILRQYNHVVTQLEQLGVDYQDYLAFQKDNPNMPIPQNVNDYALHYEQWLGNMQFYQLGYTQEQIDNYDRFSAFASQYGDLNDYRPKDLADFLANYDKAQTQLNTWTQEAGPEATGFTDNQVREYYAFKDYASQYGEPGEWFPVDIGDFFANYDQAQQQLGVWQQVAEDVEKYQISPEEALRRQEEAYARTQYAAKEAFGETPEYQPAFAQWMGGQEQFSGALQQYVEREYPSLKSEFQATQPTLTGFPTREEARAEAARRESGWQAWLTERTPELEQEYWSQRPLERGERPYMYSPAMVAKNW